MAIVKKTSETRHKARAKATIRYIMHRQERGARITRELFSSEEGNRGRYEAYAAIDNAPPGTRFLRVTLSPDPKREDTQKDLNFRELTRAMMAKFSSQFPRLDIQFFAAIHAGHTENRHVNLLVIFPGGRLTKDHWRALREAATGNARSQRKLLDREREEVRENTRFPLQAKVQKARSQSRIDGSSGVSSKQAPLCPLCMGSLSYHGRFLECDNCEISLSRNRGIGLEIRYNGRAFALEWEEGGSV